MTGERDVAPTWAALFERGTGLADPATIEAAVADRRVATGGDEDATGEGVGGGIDDGRPGRREGADGGAGDDVGGGGADAAGDESDGAGRSRTGAGDDRRATTPPGQASVVPDTAVLVSDLLVDGESRRALDCLRRHSWTTLIVSEVLLAEAAAVIADLGDEALARDWRARMGAWATTVEIPPGDHPALAAAVAGDAAHLLTTDERLLGAAAGRQIKRRVTVSAKEPAAFARLFDAASLYAAATGADVGDYPGPDRDPRG